MISCGLSGRFDLACVNAKTGEVRERRSFDNLILDIGLENFWSKSTSMQPALGVGTTPPAVTDTGLEQLVYAAQSISPSSSAVAPTSPDWVAKWIQTWRIPANAAVGTFTEIGLCNWGGVPPYWCRALIVDEQGNPSSISVLADEYLDVTYTLNLHSDLNDRTFTFEINGTTYTCTARRALIANTRISSINGSIGTVYTRSGSGGGGAWATQELGPITSKPSGTTVNSVLEDGITPQPYESNSWTGKSLLRWGLNKMNVAGGIGSICIDEGNPRLPTQFSFSPKIPKDATNELSLMFACRIHRYGEP